VPQWQVAAPVYCNNNKSHMFDPLNLLLLAAAVFIFWRLYAVLGARTGSERPPFDPFSEKPAKPLAPPREASLSQPEETKPKTPEPVELPTPVWKGFAAEGSSIAAALESLVKADGSFAPKGFLAGAKLAYEMIIEAYARGDKAALKPLLNRDVFDGFSRAIDARNAEGQKLQTRFVGISKTEITGAEVTGNRAALTVTFVSEMISASVDKSGKVIDGDPNEVREVTDVWTFERDVSSRDPNWRLVATEDPV
jgi:predicted lipid-binding transport protein (Tim44 family)